MINKALPFYLEDRTGFFHGSDYDDIYDRLFLRIAPPPPQSSPRDFVLNIYNVGRRSSSHKDHRPLQREPAVVLEFGPRGALGNVIFPSSSAIIPMNQYLKKNSMFGGSLTRKFRASDGQEYRWMYRGMDGQEWTCIDSRDHLIAHYDLKPADKPAYNTSGNILTIHESFGHLALEILTSLTIMRHIAAHNL